MKRFLITVVLVLVVGVVAVGFYRGWFAFSSRSPAAGSNEVNLNLKLDPDRMKADAATVRDQTAELVDRAKEPAAPSGAAAQETR